jgi:hypothetical protein
MARDPHRPAGSAPQCSGDQRLDAPGVRRRFCSQPPGCEQEAIVERNDLVGGVIGKQNAPAAVDQHHAMIDLIQRAALGLVAGRGGGKPPRDLRSSPYVRRQCRQQFKIPVGDWPNLGRAKYGEADASFRMSLQSCASGVNDSLWPKDIGIDWRAHKRRRRHEPIQSIGRARPS